jgi:hypothetical protein
MNKWFKCLVRILIDERGWIWPVLAGIGSAVLGSQSKKGEEEEEIYDPYAELRGEYKTYLGNKLGTSTPYKYNEAFNIDQPGIEKQAEDYISSYLKSPNTNVTDYSEATKKYSDAYKESSARSYEDEMAKTKDMYNRLGLVSSTPGLTAQGDVAENQRVSQNLFDSELLYKNLDRTLQAQGLDVNQLSDMLGKATSLGQTQRGSQEYSQTMSLADIERMTGEELDYAQLANSLLGNNAPERTIATKGDDWMSILSKLLGNVALGG